MKPMICILNALAGVLLSAGAQAHPGHGLEGSAHGLVHALWIVDALVVLSVLVAVAVRKRDDF